jgi:hypothetical protein
MILMMRATNFRAPCGVRVAGIFNSICIACAGAAYIGQIRGFFGLLDLIYAAFLSDTFCPKGRRFHATSSNRKLDILGPNQLCACAATTKRSFHDVSPVLRTAFLIPSARRAEGFTQPHRIENWTF